MKPVIAPASLATYKLLFDASPAAIAIARLSDGAFVLANDAQVDITGYSHEELIGHGSLELGIWTRPEERVKMLGILASKGVAHNLVNEIRRKSGERVRVAMSARIIDIDGEPHLLGILTYLRDLDRAFHALKDSQERMRVAEKAARFGFWEWDLERRRVHWSDGFKTLVGWSERERFDGTTDDFAHVIHRKDLARFMQVREAALAERRSFETEVRLVHRDGTARWIAVRGAPFFRTDGALQGSTGVVVDIGEEKEQRIQLQLQAEIISNMAEGVALVSASTGKFVFANTRFEQIMGYGTGELVGQHVSIVNAPDERDPVDVANQIMGELQRTGRWHGEVKNQRKDGRWIWCRASVSTFEHAEHGTVWVNVQSDITETRAALQARDEAHAELRRLSVSIQESIERERSAIARDIHDQLGAALTGIRMKLEALAQQDRLDPVDSRATLLSVAATAQAALASSRTICDRLRPPVLDDLGLAEACRWYMREWSANTGIRATGRFADPVPAPSPAVATEVFRILQELLTNAARHSGAALVRVHLSGGSRTVRLRVADDGHGFDPKKKSGGFGLLGVRERALQHGGRVEIQSSPAGAIVVVTLDVRQAAHA